MRPALNEPEEPDTEDELYTEEVDDDDYEEEYSHITRVDMRHTFNGEKAENGTIFLRLFKDFVRDHTATTMLVSIAIILYIASCIFLPELSVFFVKGIMGALGITIVAFGSVAIIAWIYTLLQKWGEK